MTAILTALCCCDRDPTPPQIGCADFMALCYGVGGQIKLQFASTLQIDVRAICDNGLPGPTFESYYAAAKARVTGVYVEGQGADITVKASSTVRRVTSVLEYVPNQICPNATDCQEQEQIAEWQGAGRLGCAVNPLCPFPTGPLSPFALPIEIYATLANTSATLRFRYLGACCLPGQQCEWNTVAPPGTVGALFNACFLPGCNYLQRCPVYTANFTNGSVTGIGQLDAVNLTACSFSDAYYDPAGGGFISISQTGSVGVF